MGGYCCCDVSGMIIIVQVNYGYRFSLFDNSMVWNILYKLTIAILEHLFDATSSDGKCYHECNSWNDLILGFDGKASRYPRSYFSRHLLRQNK